MHGNTATRTATPRASTLEGLVPGRKTLREMAQSRSRDHFAQYREYVHPDLIQDWWTEATPYAVVYTTNAIEALNASAMQKNPTVVSFCCCVG
jgi:hypothetical protein